MLGQVHLGQQLIIALTLCIILPTDGIDRKEAKTFYKSLKKSMKCLFSGVCFKSSAAPVTPRADPALYRPAPISDENDQEDARATAFDKMNCLKKCDRVISVVDICFIVQTSCESGRNKESQKNLLKNTQEKIDLVLGCVGEESLYSLVTYSQNATVQTKWTNVDTRPLQLEIDQGCETCFSRCDKALQMCQDLFDERSSTRDKVPKLIIVHTDGVSVESKYHDGARLKTIQTAQDICSTGDVSMRVREFPIPNYKNGVTGQKEFAAIHCAPPNHGDLLVSFDGITCKQIPFKMPMLKKKVPLEDEPGCPPKACCTADVAFVIDRSKSIKPYDLKILFNFAYQFINAQEKINDPHDPNEDQSRWLRFSIITYNRQVTTHAYLGEFNKEELLNVIKSIPRTTGRYTHTNDALKVAYNQFKTYGREGVRKIVFLCTDGRTWLQGQKGVYKGNDTIIQAQRIKEDFDGELFVLGLPNVKSIKEGFEKEWRHFASDPQECTIYNKLQEGKFKELVASVAPVAHFTQEICTKMRGDLCYHKT